MCVQINFQLPWSVDLYMVVVNFSGLRTCGYWLGVLQTVFICGGHLTMWRVVQVLCSPPN